MFILYFLWFDVVIEIMFVCKVVRLFNLEDFDLLKLIVKFEGNVKDIKVKFVGDILFCKYILIYSDVIGDLFLFIGFFFN